MPRTPDELLATIYTRSARIRARRRRALTIGSAAALTIVVLIGALLPSVVSSTRHRFPVAKGTHPEVPAKGTSSAENQAAPAASSISAGRSPCTCVAPRTRRPSASGEHPEPLAIPADTRVAFASDRDGTWQIYLMHADGTHVQQLTNDARPNREPAWSPDGKHIAFVSLATVGEWVGDIMVMDADGSHRRFVVHGGQPAWSPDGKRLAFIDYTTGDAGPFFSRLWTVNVDGTDARLVSTDALDATWMPDSRHVAYGAVVHGITNVHTSAIDGSDTHVLTADPVFACNPSASADGKRIAYVAFSDSADQGAGVLHLGVMNADGTGQTRITHQMHPEFQPSWFPDGTAIVVERNIEFDNHWAMGLGVDHLGAAGAGHAVLVAVAADGSGERVLSHGAYDDADPAVAPRAG